MEPGELHANTVQTDIASFRVLLIEPEVVQKASHELSGASEPHFRIAQTSAKEHPQLRRALLDLHFSLENLGTALERQARFAACLRLLLEQAVESPVAAGAIYRAPQQLDRARDFVESHLEDQISLEELAVASGFATRFELVRAFTTSLGLPPHAYHLSRRIARSRSLLRAGRPPAAVAAELGFADQSHFTRQFKRAIGATPGAYARDLRVS